MLPPRSACTQMALRPRGHSFDVPRVVYELTKRSFIMRSLYRDKSVILLFLYASTTVGTVLDALLVVVVLVCLFVCLFVLLLLVIVRSLRMSVTIN